MPARRVVSVLPSATEIVCALGHRADLIGRSEECDFPPDVQSLPAVMRPRAWDSDRPSGEIDQRVQATRGDNQSLYELDVPLLQRLQPDVLLTQDLCGVCSVTDAEVRDACAIAGVAPEVVSVSPRTLSEVWDSVDTIGRAIGAGTEARHLAAELRRRTHAGPVSSSAPRVAVVEWLDPPILAGLWAPDQVEAAEALPVHGPSGTTGLRTSWSAIRELAPDLVVLSPCSFSVARSRTELESPQLRHAIRELRPRLGVHVADEAYFSRPGPRLADGVDLLRHLLHGDRWTPPMPVVEFRTGGVTA